MMNLQKKFTMPSPSPKTPLTPLCALRNKTPRTPHTPLTPLTPMSTNRIAGAHRSMSSVAVSAERLLEESVMNWFSEKGVSRGDLG